VDLGATRRRWTWILVLHWHGTRIVYYAQMNSSNQPRKTEEKTIARRRESERMNGSSSFSRVDATTTHHAPSSPSHSHRWTHHEPTAVAVCCRYDNGGRP
jgi:hypothetical protein